MHTKYLLKIIFFFVTLLFASNLLAAGAYQIEVIVFAHKPAAGIAESWPAILHRPASVMNSVSYPELAPENFTMNNAAQALITRGGYAIILHKAWQQPIDSMQGKNAKPVRIFGGGKYDVGGGDVWQVDGTLTLHKTYYLDANLDLALTSAKKDLPKINTYVTDAAHASSSFVSFPLVQALRIHVNEVSYFDHPLFGVLLRVSASTN